MNIFVEVHFAAPDVLLSELAVRMLCQAFGECQYTFVIDMAEEGF